MRAHELAQLLLSGPNLTVITSDDLMAGGEFTEVVKVSKPRRMARVNDGPEGPAYPRFYIDSPYIKATEYEEVIIL